MRAWRRRWHLVSPTLYIIIVYRVNLNKLSRNFVGVIRTTTTNCRVCFIDFYLVFPTNFWIVFLPHTNTVILLKRVLWYYHRAWVTCGETRTACQDKHRNSNKSFRNMNLASFYLCLFMNINTSAKLL